ncbi:hypothetical protein FB45DRAFT_943184 [Roridomyces roridus]|uniref:Transmembrane protein n=1 Tax=Roridomyces roridus TaxID=1738132 RepID=A0AAD7B4N2_9AGAR|nr:hypothetical protein FB45DRAFT_943184 [Roridomyces roridus]
MRPLRHTDNCATDRLTTSTAQRPKFRDDALLSPCPCPRGSSVLSNPHFYSPPTGESTPTTAPISYTVSSPRTVATPGRTTTRHVVLSIRTSPDGLLGAELGGSLGGTALLVILLIAFYFHRQRRRYSVAARMPVRQVPVVPFVVTPTWVPGHPSPRTPRSPTSGTSSGAIQSNLSLPERAHSESESPTVRVAPQASMPNLRTVGVAVPPPSYRNPLVVRPRASTVGSESASSSKVVGAPLSRTVTEGSGSRFHESREFSGGGDTGLGPGVELPSPTRNRSDSSVWRPRIDILGARSQQQQRVREREESFWVDKS